MRIYLTLDIQRYKLLFQFWCGTHIKMPFFIYHNKNSFSKIFDHFDHLVDELKVDTLDISKTRILKLQPLNITVSLHEKVI